MAQKNNNMNNFKLNLSCVGDLIESPPRDVLGDKGFTLVELLTVVAILAVLAAVATPSYNAYIDKTRNSRAMSEINTLGTEISSYTFDHNGDLPHDLTDIKRGGFLDPWKNVYVYNNFVFNGTAPLQDPFNIQLNIDYDLYSKGSNSASSVAGADPVNQDDIVRSNNGAYIGLR